MKKLLVILGISLMFMGTSVAHKKQEIMLPETRNVKCIKTFDDALSAVKGEQLIVRQNDHMYQVYNQSKGSYGTSVGLECADCQTKSKCTSTTEIVLVSNVAEDAEDGVDLAMLPQKNDEDASVSYDVMKTLFLHQGLHGSMFSVGDTIAMNPYEADDGNQSTASVCDTSYKMHMKVTGVTSIVDDKSKEIGQEVALEECAVQASPRSSLRGLVKHREQQITKNAITYIRKKVDQCSHLHRVEYAGNEETVTKNTIEGLSPKGESTVTAVGMGIAVLCIAHMSTWLFKK